MKTRSNVNLKKMNLIHFIIDDAIGLKIKNIHMF